MLQPPEPPDHWSGERDARFLKSHCPQLPLAPEVDVIGSEDCLFLNVYTPHVISLFVFISTYLNTCLIST